MPNSNSICTRWNRGILLIVLLAIASSGRAQEETLDRIVAVVDDEIILLSELKWQIQLELMQRRMDPDQMDDAWMHHMEQEILKGMVADKMVLAKARADSIVIKPKEVDDALNEQLENFRREAGSETAYQAELEREGLTERDLKRRLRKQIEHYLLKQQVMMNLARKTTVSNKELEDFYQTHKDSIPAQKGQVSLSHIMIVPKAELTRRRSVREKAEQILQRARAGENFAELARTYSDDPGSANKGGDLGWFSRGAMMPAFEQAAFALHPGEISHLVETPLGYHIIQVEERKDDQIQARHILFMAQVTSEDKERTFEQLKALRQRALDGEDFEALARTYSEDTRSVDRGGFLGWIAPENLPPSFRTAVEFIKPGDISAPIESSSGYHIIRLNERTKGGPVNLTDHRDLLEEMVRQRKIQQAFDEMIEREKKKIYVDIRLDEG